MTSEVERKKKHFFCVIQVKRIVAGHLKQNISADLKWKWYNIALNLIVPGPFRFGSEIKGLFYTHTHIHK